MKHLVIALCLALSVVPAACAPTTTAGIETVQLNTDKTLASMQTLYVVAVDVVVALPAGPTKDKLKAIGAHAADVLHTAYKVRTAAAVAAAISETTGFLSQANAAKGLSQ